MAIRRSMHVYRARESDDKTILPPFGAAIQLDDASTNIHSRTTQEHLRMRKCRKASEGTPYVYFCDCKLEKASAYVT